MAREMVRVTLASKVKVRALVYDMIQVEHMSWACLYVLYFTYWMHESINVGMS